MFNHVDLYAGDPILSLVEAFDADGRRDKINLSVGVYLDENRRVPTLPSVLEAEGAILARRRLSPSYLPMDGSMEFRSVVQSLLFGQESAAIVHQRVVTVQALGGSGALRVGADFLSRYFPSSTVYVSNHTWDNHVGIFQAAGFTVERYRYFDNESKGLDLKGFIEDLFAMPERSIVVVQPSCHNPTGVDLDSGQWDQLIAVMRQRNVLPFLDVAYQGLGVGIEEDAYAVRALGRAGISFFVSHSFSKIFSLYNERVGALSVMCSHPDEAERVRSQLKSTVRVNYSSPPATGARLVSTILADEKLTRAWKQDLERMRQRIQEMRFSLRKSIEAKRPGVDFSYLTSQRGMFSFTGLTQEQVHALREERGVYLVGNGRLCVAGLTSANVERVAAAIVSVI